MNIEVKGQQSSRGANEGQHHRQNDEHNLSPSSHLNHRKTFSLARAHGVPLAGATLGFGDLIEGHPLRDGVP